MLSTLRTQSYLGRTAVDPQGSVIGRVDQVYSDGQTGQPAWICVRTGAAGATERYAPLHGSVIDGDTLVLQVDRSVVAASPGVANPAQLDVGAHSQLHHHYQRHLSPDKG